MRQTVHNVQQCSQIMGYASALGCRSYETQVTYKCGYGRKIVQNRSVHVYIVPGSCEAFESIWQDPKLVLRNFNLV